MDILTSIHGRKVGLGPSGELIVNGDNGQLVLGDTRSAPGAKNGSTVTAVESGDGIWRRTRLTCAATPISISDDAGVAQYGGVKVYDFPEGLICVMGCVIDGALTGYASLIDTFDGDVALGTVTATTGATLTSTEANILQSTPISQAVGEVATCDAVTAATALTEAGSRWLDGTTTAIDMFLNFVIDDNAAHGAGTATFTGTIEFVWCKIGDK